MMAIIGGDHSSPAIKGVAVTASDSTDLTGTRGLFVGGDGDLALRFAGDPDTTVTVTGVVGGNVYPFAVTRVMAATTATNIVALY